MTDAVVVGAGPNGLAAAVTLARAGLSVEVFEANDTIGGAARTLELTEPGFRHDWGSAVHPMAFASPFFRAFGLTQRIPFVRPEASYAHPLDDGAAIAWHDIARTADGLGRDGRGWRMLLGPLSRSADAVGDTVLNPLLPVPARLGTAALLGIATALTGAPGGPLPLRTDRARGLLGGVVAHTVRPPSLATAAPGVVLAALAHSTGWPIPVGGTQRIADALADDLRAHGGRIHTGERITTLDQLPSARAVLFDTSAPALLALAGARLEPGYRRALARMRGGDGVCKVDFALDAPVPWRDPDVARAGTVHIGGTWDEIIRTEKVVASGRHDDAPYVLAAQPTLFDRSRAPEGKHVLWTYTHVPAGSTRDMTETVTRRIEQYASGFRDVIRSSSVLTAEEVGLGDATLVAGDIAAGAITLRQLIARPTARRPWDAGPGLYLCSGDAVPGPGVHGMGGWHAARRALRDVFHLPEPDLSPAASAG